MDKMQLDPNALSSIGRVQLNDPRTGNALRLEPDDSMPVTIQDSTTPSLIVYANRVTDTTALTVATAKDNKTIEIDDATAILLAPTFDPSYIGIFDLEGNQFWVGSAVGLAGNVVTIDTPINTVFPAGSVVGIGTKNMNVNGSVTPVVYTLRGADPGLQISVDITRFMIYCITTAAVNLTDFGDIVGGLTNGLVIRRVDGSTVNLVNYHTNIEMKGIMFDWESLDDSNPGQGLHGFTGRFTIGKLGSVMRIGPGESVEFIVQDDLSTLLGLFIIPEGSVVTP